MQVSSVNYYSYPKNRQNLNFKSKVRYVLSGNASEDLKDKIDKFEETHSNAQFLGEGLFARAYRLNGTNVVIKESLNTDIAKKANGSFSTEAGLLKIIPQSMKNSQRLVANVQTEKGNYYLLSTLVSGTKPDVITNNWEKKHFKSLFKSLYELDINGIYHNDLNRGNCLIAPDGTANLIDYQYAQSFNINNTYTNDNNFRTPSFMAPSNAQMFEMANLPFYLNNLNEKGSRSGIKNIFKEYLIEKSDYCKSRANFLRFKKASPDMVKYEQLQSKFLKNPSDDMIELQAMKLQLLYSYRQAFSIIDVNNESQKNILSAIPCYLYAAACAKKFSEQAEKLKNSTTNSELKELCNYEARYGKYWQDKLLEDMSGSKVSSDGEYGAFKWILRNAKLNPHWKNGAVDPADSLAEQLKTSSDMEFGSVPFLTSVITGKNYSIPKEKYVWGILGIKQDFYALDSEIKKSMCNYKVLSTCKKQRAEIEKNKKRFIDAFQQTFCAIDQQRIIACIPSALKALYNASLMKKEVDSLNNCYLDYSTRTYVTYQKSLADKAVTLMSDITEKLYERAVSAIKGNDRDLANALNYEKLNEFDAQNHAKYNPNQQMKFWNDI